MISVHQIYFDDNTKKRIEGEFIPYLNASKDGYFENTVIKDIYQKMTATPQAFAQADKYIGISSWKQRSKTALTGGDIIGRIQNDIRAGKEKDVYLYPPTSIVKPNYDNIPLGYTMNGIIKGPDIWTQHRAFGDKVFNVDVLLDNSKVLPFDLFDSKWVFAHCNYWICTKEVFKEYYETVLGPAINFFEQPHIKQIVPQNYIHSHEGKKYTYCSFAMEGLFGAFLAHREYSYAYIVKRKVRARMRDVNIIGFENGNGNFLPVREHRQLTSTNSPVPALPVAQLPNVSIPVRGVVKNTLKLRVDKITPAQKDIYVFFHICCINNYISVTHEMINSIVESGLYEDCKMIYYSILGTMDEGLGKRISSLDKFQLIHLSGDIKEVEYPTLINLKKLCKDKDGYILYIHTKGVSLPKDDFRQYWRKRLMQKVVNEYKICMSFLNEGCDIAGCGWKETPKTEKVQYQVGEHEHFSGNFWWATSKFINRLPDIDAIRDKYYPLKNADFLRYRVQCEFWIGMSANMQIGINGELNKEYSDKNYYNPYENLATVAEVPVANIPVAIPVEVPEECKVEEVKVENSTPEGEEDDEKHRVY